MRRKLFTILWLASLVLCVGTTGLWVRTWGGEGLAYVSRGHSVISIIVEQGRTHWEVVRYREARATEADALLFTAEGVIKMWGQRRELRDEALLEELSDASGRRRGLHWGSGEGHFAEETYEFGKRPPSPAYRYGYVSYPTWLLAAALSLLPMGVVARRVRATCRRGPDCCRACGYDLTGNVSGRCPECGTLSTVVTARY